MAGRRYRDRRRRRRAVDARSVVHHVTAMLVLRLRLRLLAPPRASAALG